MTDAVQLRDLLMRFHAKDRAALNRLISLVSRGEAIDRIREELAEAAPTNDQCARVIAVTGNSGVGKSSLIAQLIEVIRGRGETVAVLACDPQSAFTGGALLGDRVRMSAHARDEGVWIRSLASVSGRQGLADHLDLAALLLRQFGFDRVLLETVGAGQGDVAVEALADVVVLLIQPEIGDELQWEKAGVLEVADVVVVHKGDLPGAERTEVQVRGQLNLPGCPTIPVVRVSSRTKVGLAELWSAIEHCGSYRRFDKRNARSLLRIAQERLTDRFADNSHVVQEVVQKWAHGRLTDVDAADQVLVRLMTTQRRSSEETQHD
jgi:LAO/AO transport system ATPase